MGTFGSDLLQSITSGEMDHPTLKVIDQVRSEVTPALVELLSVGARFRPMDVGGKLVGFVRGVHFTERRQLFQWFTQPVDRIHHMLRLGTTLTDEDIQGLDGFEARYLLRAIDTITEADLSLYPYIAAFSTTSASEILWHGRGRDVAAIHGDIALPGGWAFSILMASDHARLWATLAASRERSKRRLDDTYNAAMVTRALVGKGSDKLFSSLKKTQAALATDNPDPWAEIVKVEVKDINFNDGWGHSHQDDSVEGVIREVTGMAKMDRHERYMEAFYRQQVEAAARQEAELDQRFADVTGVDGLEESVTRITPEQLRQRQLQDREDTQAREAEILVALTAAQDAEDRKERRESGRAHPFN